MPDSTQHHEIHDWQLIYDDWERNAQPLREALCTLGNGYMAMRGAFEEAAAAGVHYPGFYIPGGYNRRESEVSGRLVENEDLVNWPNWLPLTFRAEGGDWFDIDKVTVHNFHQELELQRGMLIRELGFEDDQERVWTLKSRRIVSMAERHVGAIHWSLTPENWSGPVEIRATLDGTVTNSGVDRYSELEGQHLNVITQGRTAEDSFHLVAESNQAHLVMAQAARFRVWINGERPPLSRNMIEEENVIGQTIALECQQKKPLYVEKVVSVFTSRDAAISSPLHEACFWISRLRAFDELAASHARAWRHLWHRADINFHGSNEAHQGILRLYIFHMLQSASMHTIDLDVGVPARGLHGEAYRGHIFWDELFIFPFIMLCIPELARSLLMYRYRRLPRARLAAAEAGFEGAMFPWQSGSDGREESQVLHLNPESGEWDPDNTFRQRHVNAAIAWNIWQYYQSADDWDFMSFYGAEMLIDIARFWASIAHYNSERDRYEIHHIVGPDEFHTQFPDSDSIGLNNNAYTNVMAVWCLRTAAEVYEMLPTDRQKEILETLDLSDDEFHRWDRISRSMFVPINDDGIIEQFEGFFNLEELDWEGLKKKWGDIQRLDRILKAEEDDPNKYKASKQADVLMLFYLFDKHQLKDMFEHMGYDFTYEWIPKNVNYYLERTSHGSTLSSVVHAWVLARSMRENSWPLFERGLRSDIDDVQGGTTPEGIHLGAMAGTIDLAQRCYGGVRVGIEKLHIDPQLPEEIETLDFTIRYRGQWLHININHAELKVRFFKGWARTVKICHLEKDYVMKQGEEKVFQLQEAN